MRRRQNIRVVMPKGRTRRPGRRRPAKKTWLMLAVIAVAAYMFIPQVKAMVTGVMTKFKTPA